MSLQEPSYQSVEIGKEYAKHELMNGWFCDHLCSDTNTYETNKELNNVIKTMDVCMFHSVMPRHSDKKSARNNLQHLINTVRKCKVSITFEMLRRNENWKITLERIVEEEVSKISLGSARGFMTFVYRPLCNIIIARTIRELWALPVITGALKRYAKIWIERNYSIYGKGYIKLCQQYASHASFKSS